MDQSEIVKLNKIKAKSAWLKKGAARSSAISCGLGIGIGFGIALFIFSQTLRGFGIYLAGLCTFHMWEYIWVTMYHPDKLSSKSFLLNHSPQFNMALLISFIEFWIEWYFFPSLKTFSLWWVGAICMVFGQIVRSVAMDTAGSNFTHLVQEEKRDDHVLVTNGIYQYMRHPSYFGWFVWSVSTQVILMNPISIIGFGWASWSFFSQRIENEEDYLIQFFGKSYKDYKKSVWSGIPGIH
ncbi:prenylcysteine methyltransferase [Dictyostelium discoideum AX4]|uniref:Protein-S-isoprenylcysteine O-methyltransferase n=1 Tax=Dictyostelium discoideum TaxID=44689 RepID=ICMT_DICDI|nr:prenylcysteine methyltransferase [Dictyostelium discoideum AX4]XP_645058.2 prenylcysteine methyltransferase [Dictyostelium discoideum AX4]Q558K8.2 RecName: Full=Protein-S-isoprenylcysteine O-methyltransferase; AltName: Full=Isoprenylcysteine carboxylmethyltransferase; AltName: Full=Prenylated protein carboxyl methyltransferase; Short=PPMT; AltName: Full=Prenylcysteine carboxyl methyltransferase; Short=pcCMT [Dictyostelium discoideum]AAL99548.1 prenyl cysteine carboxyl methyltransferase [Dicty|eukprot:XP_644356.1 prenylcysteine methyltransferase [Dictyostelium discoideum AX4]